MKTVRLIHWNDAEAKERAGRVKEAGYDVSCELPRGPQFLRDLRAHSPVAVLIDLSRLPSQGRDLAVAIRHQKSTRHIPLVFVDGDPEKVAKIKNVLPDAVYTSWGRLKDSLKQAIARAPGEPVAPQSVFSGYSGTPLAKKLGIKPVRPSRSLTRRRISRRRLANCRRVRRCTGKPTATAIW
jgi:DNA-binding NarL/FixJ family response regulator